MNVGYEGGDTRQVPYNAGEQDQRQQTECAQAQARSPLAFAEESLTHRGVLPSSAGAVRKASVEAQAVLRSVCWSAVQVQREMLCKHDVMHSRVRLYASWS